MSKRIHRQRPPFSLGRQQLVFKKTADAAARTSFDREVRDAVDALIISTTPKKYHPTLVNALTSNRNEMGDTVWAIMQAVSEVSTHDMVGLNAQDWQLRQTNMVLNRAGILV